MIAEIKENTCISGTLCYNIIKERENKKHLEREEKTMIKLTTIEKDFNEVKHLVNMYNKEPELRDSAMEKLIKISAIMTISEIEEKLKQHTISVRTREKLIDKKYFLLSTAKIFTNK